MRRPLRFVPLAIAATLLATSMLESSVQQQSTAADLRNVLATGYILQDRNTDDVIDFVNARIVLPASPSEADAVAAANVAARLGYETSASNLEPASFDNAASAGYD